MVQGVYWRGLLCTLIAEISITYLLDYLVAIIAAERYLGEVAFDSFDFVLAFLYSKQADSRAFSVNNDNNIGVFVVNILIVANS